MFIHVGVCAGLVYSGWVFEWGEGCVCCSIVCISVCVHNNHLCEGCVSQSASWTWSCGLSRCRKKKGEKMNSRNGRWARHDGRYVRFSFHPSETWTAQSRSHRHTVSQPHSRTVTQPHSHSRLTMEISNASHKFPSFELRVLTCLWSQDRNSLLTLSHAFLKSMHDEVMMLLRQ